MSQKTKIIGLMIFKIICIVVGLVLWFGGRHVFFAFKADMGWLMGWIMWGFFAILAMPLEFLKNLVKGAKDGAEEGANTYKINDYGSTFTVSNTVGRGTFMGIVITAIVTIMAGPIVLGFNIINNLYVVLQCILVLRRINKEHADH